MQERKGSLPRKHSSTAGCLDTVCLGKHVLLGNARGIFTPPSPSTCSVLTPLSRGGRKTKEPRAGVGNVRGSSRSLGRMRRSLGEHRGSEMGCGSILWWVGTSHRAR